MAVVAAAGVPVEVEAAEQAEVVATAEAPVAAVDMAAERVAVDTEVLAAVDTVVLAAVDTEPAGRADTEVLDPAIRRQIRSTTILILNHEILFRSFRRVPRPTSRCCTLLPRGPAGLSFTTRMIYSAAWNASPKSKTNTTFSDTRLLIRQTEVATPYK